MCFNCMQVNGIKPHISFKFLRLRPDYFYNELGKLPDSEYIISVAKTYVAFTQLSMEVSYHCMYAFIAKIVLCSLIPPGKGEVIINTGHLVG